METPLNPAEKNAQLLEVLKAEARRAGLVDEFGKLEAELMPHRAKIRRLEELSKVIRGWHADHDPEQGYKDSGNDFEVIVSAATMQTHFAPMKAIFKALGKAKFLAAASITLKALEANLDAAGVLALTTKKRTGPRTLLVVAVPHSEPRAKAA
jgi:hypothetical protein